jgi:Ca-activated chloride channel family protein
MENLREAIRQALESGELFDEEAQEQFETALRSRSKSSSTDHPERMQEQNFINAESPSEGQGQQGDAAKAARPASKSPTRAWTSSATRPCATCSAARQIQPRPPRHPPRGRRRRDQRQLQALRVRRHPQPRHHRHALLSVFAREGLATAISEEQLPSTSSTPTCTSTSPTTNPPAPRSSCSTARTP